MKKSAFLILIMLLLAGNWNIKAQTSQYVVFDYDDNGNRTMVEYIIVRYQDETPEELSSDNIEVSCEVDISIYPNPTTGYIVLATDYNDISSINVKLMSLQGTVIYERRLTNSHEEFDLTNAPAGVYIVTIEHKGDKQLWKIIKK